VLGLYSLGIESERLASCPDLKTAGRKLPGVDGGWLPPAFTESSISYGGSGSERRLALKETNSSFGFFRTTRFLKKLYQPTKMERLPSRMRAQIPLN